MRGSKTLVVLLMCCTLVLMRALGVHVHLPLDGHGHGESSQGMHSRHHHEPLANVLLEHDAEHAQAHLEHGEIDAEPADEMPGKLASTPLFMALLATAFLFLAATASGRQAWPSVARPPGWRRWLHVLPPSQAPPQAS